MIDGSARIVVSSALEIGDDVFIGKNATLIAFDRVTIGARVLIGENVSIHSEDHGPPGDRDTFATCPVTIEDDVWLGAGVVVTRKGDVGARSTVGANSVVSGRIPPDVLAAGLPARVVRPVL